jgi:N6-adenosine-specific RNA methylase IME4/ParB-like chromosome segregation protein Spo0J
VERLRALRNDTVKSLMESMTANGLLQPIVLRPRGSAGYWLVAGRHRFEAARNLKWESIAATIFEGMDADHAELAEIDENMVRADLSPAELALHTDARKTLYEKLHPETKTGKAPAKRGGKGGKLESQNENLTFVKDTAEKTGKGRSTVARNATRGKEGRDWLKEITDTPLDQGDEIDALIGLPADDRAKLIARAKAGEKVSAKNESKKVKREAKEQSLAVTTRAAAASLGAKLYNVIYADPPWKFEPYSQETGMDRSADNHYPTMDLDGIKTIPIPAAEDAALFLWATVPMLPQALDVMRAWGFSYVSNYVWVKDRIGTGYWGRNKHELLLIGTRGNIPAPAPGTQPISAIIAPTDRHSAKPNEFRQIIEKMFPNLPRLEMFARGEIDGWDTFGNESEAA